MKELIYLAVFLAGVLIVSAIIRPQQDYDCSDFSTQREAQKMFEKHSEDIYQLDGNKNLLPCEHLPK